MSRTYPLAALLYVLLFMPLTASLAFLEGALRGMWPFTLADWMYQSGAFAVYNGGLLLVFGVLTVPVTVWLLRWWADRSRAVAALRGAVVAPVALLLLPSAALALMAALGGQPWRLGLLLLAFPFGYSLASAIFGAALALTGVARRDRSVA